LRWKQPEKGSSKNFPSKFKKRLTCLVRGRTTRPRRPERVLGPWLGGSAKCLKLSFPHWSDIGICAVGHCEYLKRRDAQAAVRDNTRSLARAFLECKQGTLICALLVQSDASSQPDWMDFGPESWGNQLESLILAQSERWRQA
jgi:hypothetical protein